MTVSLRFIDSLALRDGALFIPRLPQDANAHGKGRSTRNDCSRNDAEGMRELAWIVERPSEP